MMAVFVDLNLFFFSLDWTVVQVSVVNHGAPHQPVLLTRFARKQAPVVVQVPGFSSPQVSTQSNKLQLLYKYQASLHHRSVHKQTSSSCCTSTRLLFTTGQYTVKQAPVVVQVPGFSSPQVSTQSNKLQLLYKYQASLHHRSVHKQTRWLYTRPSANIGHYFMVLTVYSRFHNLNWLQF